MYQFTEDCMTGIAMVDEEFDIALKGDDISTAVTVEDVYNNVKAKA